MVKFCAWITKEILLAIFTATRIPVSLVANHHDLAKDVLFLIGHSDDSGPGGPGTTIYSADKGWHRSDGSTDGCGGGGCAARGTDAYDKIDASKK